MSRDEFPSSVDAATAHLLWTADGDLPPDASEALRTTLASEGARLGVVVLTTAALGCIDPQPDPATLGPLRALVDAALRRASGADEPLPLRALDAACSALPERGPGAARRSVASSVGHALSFLDEPSPETWHQLLRAFRGGHLARRKGAEDLREGWTNWIDDVVLVPDDRRAGDVLVDLQRLLEHPVADVPPSGEFVVVQYEVVNDFEVMLVPKRDRKNLRELGRFAVTLDGTTLNVLVSEPRAFMRDKLRVEYAVVDLALRRFMGGYFDGRYDRIEYRIDANGESWGRDAYPNS